MTAWFSSKRPGRWGMTFSARGTAYVVFRDGTTVTVFHQPTPARALLRAWRIHQHPTELRPRETVTL